MDREQVKKIIPTLQGFVDGGELQQRAIGHGADWHKQNGSFVINGGWEYRLKPKAREWWVLPEYSGPHPGYRQFSDKHIVGYVHVREVISDGS